VTPGLRKKYVFVITAFYTVMELTQTIQYAYVNECGNFKNYWLSEFAYVLVIVQPLMYHTVFYLRNKQPEERVVFKVSIALCIVWMLFSILGRVLYNANDKNDTNTERWSYLYSTQTCTLRDKPTSHLYWQWTSRNMMDMNANYLTYIIIWFVPPWFVPKERFTIFSVMLSFTVALYMTLAYGKLEENPATWCFFSAPFFVFIYLKQIKHVIYNIFQAHVPVTAPAPAPSQERIKIQ
jgi:hypothetical protein